MPVSPQGPVLLPWRNLKSETDAMKETQIHIKRKAQISSNVSVFSAHKEKTRTFNETLNARNFKPVVVDLM